MDTGSSVSKGCFVYKGKKRNVNPADYFKACEYPSSWKPRQSVCDETWEEIDQEIQILRSDLNSKIFDDLLTFTNTCQKNFCFDDDQGHKVSFVTEIPTAALVTGVNTPDHGVMFSTLVELLHERVTPLVANLKSKDCNRVKNVLTKTLGQLLKNPELFANDEEETITNTKNIPCTLSTLSSWYMSKYKQKQSHSPTKKRKSTSTSHHTYPPIVIVFEDLESWIPQVLQDFISICSNYIHQIPIVFVFGIATSVAAVHRLLPNTVSSLLCMEKFQAPPSTEYLTLVINQIIMTSRFPFKLGSKVFQLLLDIFLYHDFSVLNFVKGLQYCILDHFFSFPCSQIFCHQEDLHPTVKGLSHTDVESIRMIPSFMRYVEGCPPQQQIDLLEDDEYTKKKIKGLISKIYKYHELFFPVLKCLHILVAKLPKHPLGKQLREVYAITLASFVCETESYKVAFELLKMMSRDDLTELINTIIKEVEPTLHFGLQDIPKDLGNFLQRFDTLHEIVEEEEEENTTESALHLEKTDLHSLRKRLMEAGKKTKKLSPYEKLRMEVIDYFDSVFRKFLLCPKSLPLHEVFYYDSAADVKRHLNSSPRSAVQTALASPHHYLHCKCCEMDSGILSPSMPDICIVYKLHLECTLLINLFDWLQAFVTVVTSDEEEEDDGKKRAVDKVLQARFIRAVSELQFLGFIKPTKRKTDHVARLTWGGC